MGLLDDLAGAAPGATVTAADDDLTAYRDIGGPAGRFIAIAVPRSAEDVAAILRSCDARGVPVVPWGGGTNLSKALSPARRAVALDLKALDRITPDIAGMSVRAGAGATPDRIDRALARHGLRFHHDPWSRTSATVGGSLALNSAGCLYGGYGRIGDQVASLVVALADGTVIDVPGPGADGRGVTPATFIGTEGTMGVILEATFRVHRRPEAYRTLGFGFRSFRGLFEGLSDLEEGGLRPDSFIGGTVPRNVARLQPAADRAMMRALGIRCGLFAYFEGTEEAAAERSEAASALLSDHGRRMPQGYSDAWWPRRHVYFEGNPGAVGRSLSAHVRDLVIPPGRTMEAHARVEELAASLGLADMVSTTLFTSLDAFTVALYLGPGERDTEAFRAFEGGVVDMALDMGSVMRIHGYGSNFDPEVVRRALGGRFDGLMAAKRALDPNWTLNPGILLPDMGERGEGNA
ncbi:MAG: FAD-binding oxidoreductase [Thermoplasmata archaeon]|nr:FAD-binding oxidoreductase [Thermoplasmata archaeon]